MTADSAAWEALRLSLWVACWATALAVPLALWVAWILARKSFWGKSLLNAAVHLPLVLPPVVTGYLLLISFSPNAPLGRMLSAMGLQLAFHWTGAVLAAIVMGFPLMVRAMRLAIEAVDPKLEEAAETLGASRISVFARVTLPLIGPGILAGAVMGFAKAMGEFGATITFVANIPGQTQTLPGAIWAALQIPGGEGQAVMMVMMASIVAVAAVLLSEVLARRVSARIAAK
ncbi:molybdate ABC transporter permease subunit [Sulfitobacter mediterraneus]|uniref:molybdate ABC transporter permease subunit n=1 Tax=Sulfitobacter mediterraneus TaxID=83219 RepID=UPI001933B939|nr:molybdate ABC transporter permease subunit [Sulfitobacter mediterraneus]MBM1631292.1 molybdate ABC transporter permease subunit [Sulfitobacter mediterraneus]MBM1639105.1 molybdate ABC transporter permease subunit [Sulfitobacter mediterraneus]MBM1643154.1 molybdate ABC transporter permease subunit [Sulfitobacter mediterraneus]MBM1647202.1 molybdate ABC transporter permease subunit [Sulfitobacter mediterraneus]MBM1651245.1 molybdate ABC transporter permease subunit [Sulfitobacter mediterraneu